SRASVPPQASDSSSGCAKTATIVRPSTVLGTTVTLHQLLVDCDVAVDHPVEAESGDGVLADTPTIEREHARQVVDHPLEILEHDPRNPVVHHLADGAAIERGDGCAARHRFGEDEAEGFARLNGI